MIIKTNHHHINDLIVSYEKEKEQFRKVHRLIDLLETIIKTYTAIMLAEGYRKNQLSEDVKAYISEGIKRPSLGLWQDFSRTISDELAWSALSKEEFLYIKKKIRKKEQKKKWIDSYTEGEHNFYVDRRMISWLKQKVTPLINDDHNFSLSRKFIISNFYSTFQLLDQHASRVIQVRNSFAHGATPPNSECEKYIIELEPILKEWLNYDWFHKTTIVFFEKDQEVVSPTFLGKCLQLNMQNFQQDVKENIPYLLTTEGELLSLYPIMKCEHADGAPAIIFFNDIRNKGSVMYLDYTRSLHIKNTVVYEEFEAFFEFNSWKGKLNQEFRERILELTENFKGRRKEIDVLKNWVLSQSKGFYFMYGSPGIGKSAIIANLLEQPYEKTEQLITIKYFIRRGSRYDKIETLLEYFIGNFERYLGVKETRGKTVEERVKMFHELLRKTSTKLHQQNKKMILIIDGLDEIEDHSREVLSNKVINGSYNYILFIFTGRIMEGTIDFYHCLPYEHKNKVTVKGLEKEAILSILYEAVNKYELEGNYITMVEEKSEGNPLYLKLLCEALTNHEIEANDIEILPNKIEDFYEGIIHRYLNSQESDFILRALYIFAQAKEAMSVTHLQKILQIGPAQAEKLILSLYEILYEDELDKKHYQLYHESLRDFLRQTRKNQLNQAEEEILLFCRQWKQYFRSEDQLLRYSLQHYASHAYQLEQYEELYELALSPDFIEKQIKVLNQFQFSFYLYELALNAARQEKNVTLQVQIAVNLFVLHQQLRNNVENVLKWGTDDNIELLEKSLQELELYQVNDKCIMYTLLLYMNVLAKEKVDLYRIQLILNHIEKNITNNKLILNWLEIVPFFELFEILLVLKKNRVNTLPITSRIMLTPIDFSKIEMLSKKNKSAEFGVLLEELSEQLVISISLRKDTTKLFFSLLSMWKLLYDFKKIDKCKELIQFLDKLAIGLNEGKRMYSFTQIGRIHRLLGNEKEAFYYYEKAFAWRPKVNSTKNYEEYSLLVQELTIVGKLFEARQVWSEAYQEKIPYEISVQVIIQLANEGDLNRALDLYRIVRQSKQARECIIPLTKCFLKQSSDVHDVYSFIKTISSRVVQAQAYIEVLEYNNNWDASILQTVDNLLNDFPSDILRVKVMAQLIKVTANLQDYQDVKIMNYINQLNSMKKKVTDAWLAYLAAKDILLAVLQTKNLQPYQQQYVQEISAILSKLEFSDQRRAFEMLTQDLLQIGKADVLEHIAPLLPELSPKIMNYIYSKQYELIALPNKRKHFTTNERKQLKRENLNELAYYENLIVQFGLPNSFRMSLKVLERAATYILDEADQMLEIERTINGLLQVHKVQEIEKLLPFINSQKEYKALFNRVVQQISNTCHLKLLDKAAEQSTFGKIVVISGALEYLLKQKNIQSIRSIIEKYGVNSFQYNLIKNIIKFYVSQDNQQEARHLIETIKDDTNRFHLMNDFEAAVMNKERINQKLSKKNDQTYSIYECKGYLNELEAKVKGSTNSLEIVKIYEEIVNLRTLYQIDVDLLLPNLNETIEMIEADFNNCFDQYLRICSSLNKLSDKDIFEKYLAHVEEKIDSTNDKVLFSKMNSYLASWYRQEGYYQKFQVTFEKVQVIEHISYLWREQALDFVEKSNFVEAITAAYQMPINWRRTVTIKEILKKVDINQFLPIYKEISSHSFEENFLSEIFLLSFNLISHDKFGDLLEIIEQSNLARLAKDKLYESFIINNSSISSKGINVLISLLGNNVYEGDLIGRILYIYANHLNFIEGDKNLDFKKTFFASIEGVIENTLIDYCGENKNKYSYENIDEWLQFVTEEDDLEDIRGWIRRVEKGKMTIDKFNQYVHDLLFL